jgi:hypothetical protein
MSQFDWQGLILRLRLWHTWLMAKRPRDSNQLAKLIVDIALGDEQDTISDGKKCPQPKRGQSGGLKGGKARAKRLSQRERAEIARLGAAARWKNG